MLANPQECLYTTPGAEGLYPHFGCVCATCEFRSERVAAKGKPHYFVGDPTDKTFYAWVSELLASPTVPE